MSKIVIRANPPCWEIGWKEIGEYRDLLWLLISRDLTAVYKQTVLGPLWIVIQSLLTSGCFTLIFGKVAGISTDGIPQFIFFMAGNTLWTYAIGVFTSTANSLTLNTGVLSKVYFPRLIIPLSGVISNMVQLALNYIVFSAVFLYFLFGTENQMAPSWLLVCIPILVLHCALIGLGVGLWMAALTIKYKDLRFALPFLSQIWMYASAVVFPCSAIVNPNWKIVLWLNPLSTVMEIHRVAFTGKGELSMLGLSLSLVVTLITLGSGLLMFNRAQHTFVDTI
jgi:lipopolysaccharide transport system permease protein